jgi:hypothetical protein
MKNVVRFAAASAAMAAGLGLADLDAATQAQAQPGPFRSGAQVTSGTQVGVPTGTGEAAQPFLTPSAA